jgi:thiosulfate dehydrogenase [quinone] large subunit
MAQQVNSVVDDTEALSVSEVLDNPRLVPLVGLRVVLGGMILFAGLGKVSEWPFDAAGYLANINSASPVSGLYGAMASSPVLMDIINVVVPATQLLIGVAVITGICVRLAAVGGAIQMMLFYLGGWSGEFLSLFGSTLIYAVGFLTIAALGVGRLAGGDGYIEQLDIVQNNPKLRYILG